MEQQPRHAWEWTKSNKNKQTNKKINKKTHIIFKLTTRSIIPFSQQTMQ